MVGRPSSRILVLITLTRSGLCALPFTRHQSPPSLNLASVQRGNFLGRSFGQRRGELLERIDLGALSNSEIVTSSRCL
ncbi:hypothetical protein DPMN_079489 [Dreissena polymorpha]|uniref:Secreted protein n=1 Tax=Dreissena polymorpha TaxID=45954 RepID=A0A9D4BR24_DREPO|nr:hypothetical protein DPMN_079489 [Dreissena polymorpha]